MINKNKEEILNKINEMDHMFDSGIDYKYGRQLEIQLEAIIKTSILWCKDEIKFCNEILSQNPNAVNDEDAKYKRKQLQTHLKWLKEQEQTE